MFYYLKRTHELWLIYSRSTLDLHRYMNADRNIARLLLDL